MSSEIKSGFTKIDNDLFEAILRYPFTKRELNIVLAVIRKTTGFNKRMDDLSLSQLGKMTGINESNISRTIRDLSINKVLLKQQGKYATNIGINSKYQEWRLLPNQQGGCRNNNTAIAKTTIKGLPKQQIQKKPPKDNIKTKEHSSFDSWYSSYPLKKSRGAAEKVFIKINPDEKLLSKMIEAIEKQKVHHSKLRDLNIFAPEWKYPATWLNSECWLDEIDNSEINRKKVISDDGKKSAGQRARESLERARNNSDKSAGQLARESHNRKMEQNNQHSNIYEHLEEFE